MEQHKRKHYIRKFLQLSQDEQQDMIALMHEFELALLRNNSPRAYHKSSPINSTSRGQGA